MAAVTEADTTGFCCALVKPFGPVQPKVVPMSVPPVKLSAVPAQASVVFAPATAVGVGFFTKVNAVVCVVPKPEHVTSTTNSHVPTGIVAVDCELEVPSGLRVGLPTGP